MIWYEVIGNRTSAIIISLIQIDEQLVQASGKFLILDRMLPELKKRGHKVKFTVSHAYILMINSSISQCQTPLWL